MQEANLQLHSHDNHFNLLLVSQSNQLTTISGRLIGIHSPESDYFRFKPELPHILVTDDDLEFFNKLKRYGHELCIPELTESRF